ncbi:ATP-binding protein [Nocardiopsis dassonvillei]|uniref:protein DpdH n=1 Tax=Nocardiopsis dassonvillei TaxID=2014 RepID=UPI00200BE691|nr:protein DpdH [Nocardiopsis dassonvillei]MCK9871170.1 ATP-binding protein [Nocardiopsis dassonvillei]
MADFSKELCWAPHEAARTINTEAVSPSPAVFLATHTPLRIRRSRIHGRSLTPTDTVVNEEAVLKDFLTRRSDTGTLLMPVVGDSGSGKSHLVRWVREKIPTSDKHHVIYLEKARTSLKAVIEELLQGIEDESLTNLRNTIRSFSEGTDETALARRLVNALNEALAGTTPKDTSSREARVLTGPKGLATILQDPNIQEHLLGSGKFIPLLAQQLLNDRKEGSQERPPGFTVDDLPLSLKDVDKTAAAASRKIFNLMLARQNLQTAAVDLLNQHLETAVRNVSNLGSGRLHEAMLQVRKAYARQGKEIILLVEDFALIQGVQRELLDAVTEAAHREGNLRFAPIRTLMAVTTGYFHDLPETAMSRVSAATTGYVYDLDVTFSQENNGTEPISSFVGRYLNAARIGHLELERLGQGNVPNKCDTCAFKDQCHEEFGATEEGHGLYPLNRQSLMRMVHSVAPENQPWAFVPRTVLGSVVRPLLTEHAKEISEGLFPSDRFKERFQRKSADSLDTPLSSSTVAEVERLDNLDPERRKIVLEFWGNSPNDPHDISPGILTAFSLLPLPEGERSTRPKPQKTDTPASSPTPDQPPQKNDLPKGLRTRIEAVENWQGRDQVLPQTIARDIRIMVAESVIRRYSWQSPPMRELSKGSISKTWPNNSTTVSIEGAGAENLSGAESAPIRFARNATNSLFFQSLLQLKEGKGHPRAEDVRRLARTAERYSKDLTKALQHSRQTTDADLVLGLRASLLGAALGGRAWPGMDESELLSASLDDGQDWTRGDSDVRTSSWSQILERHLKAREELIGTLRSSLGIGQGTGEVRLIDAARALPLLQKAASVWTWDPEGNVPDWVRKSVQGFSHWMSLVEDQSRELYGLVVDVRRMLPRGTSGAETVQTVDKALGEAAKVGLGLSRETQERLRTLISHARKADWRTITTLDDELAKIGATDGQEQDRLRVVAAVRDHGASLHVIHQFLTESNQWLDEALENAAARGGTDGESAVNEVQRLLEEWNALADHESEWQK